MLNLLVVQKILLCSRLLQLDVEGLLKNSRFLLLSSWLLLQGQSS